MIGGVISMKSVGYNIKKWRKESGLTQEEMAKKLGISRSYLANLEAGRKNVGEATIKSMAEKSGLSTYYLTTGKKSIDDMSYINEKYNKTLSLPKNIVPTPTLPSIPFNPFEGLIEDFSKLPLKESFSKNMFSKQIKDLRNNLAHNLTDLSDSDLSFYEIILFSEIINFLKESNDKDVLTLSSLVAQLNKYKETGKDDEMKQDELLAFIEGETEYFKEFLKRYYAYDEKSD